MNTEKIRQDFPFLKQEIDGKPVIYFDNAATTLKPRKVIDAITGYYENYSVNVHRAFYRLGERATMEYDEAHEKTAKFIGAEKKEEIVFTKNTTESINLVVNSLVSSGMINKGDEVLTTIMEHHSSILPCLMLKKKGFTVNVAEINDNYEIDLNDFQKKLSKKTKFVSFAMVSNTIGTINPVEKIIKMIRDVSPEAFIMLDGAQGVPHEPVNVKKLDCDFLAFSPHKMLGPTGLGVLYGKLEHFEKMNPFLLGGGMIAKVTLDEIKFAPPFEKFEAGTPPIAQAIGFSAAMDYLNEIGMDKIRNYEKELTKEMLKAFEGVNSIKLRCPKDADKQTPVFLFSMDTVHPHDIAALLDEMNAICVRAGLHCAEPLLRRLSEEGFARASLYIYNTKDEIKVFGETIREIEKMFEK